jgi:6-pyruvoyltetrahydropterin 2'-reductase
MAKYEWSETFMSIEGEGPYSGTPTAYVRFSKCNFECRGFNNPNDVDPASPEVLGFDPKLIATVQDIPEITVGCDSIYAWHNDFKHTWHKGDEIELSTELVALLPDSFKQMWTHPVTNQDAILSITGGEPTLRAKTIPTLLKAPALNSLAHLLIETNCAVPLRDNFITALNEWIDDGLQRGVDRKVTWSNSPKLAVSGEVREKAIVPANAVMQMSQNLSDRFEQYFKFVCDETDASFDEVASVMEEYHAGGVSKDAKVYIMPVCCTEDQQKEIMQAVADKCIERGYIYCHRIHNTVYENAIGK